MSIFDPSDESLTDAVRHYRVNEKLQASGTVHPATAAHP